MKQNAATQDKGTKQQHQRSLSSNGPSYTMKTREKKLNPLRLLWFPSPASTTCHIQ